MGSFPGLGEFGIQTYYLLHQGGEMPIEPLRRQIIELARDAFERRNGFEIIDSLGIPALWESFCPDLVDDDAKKLCKTYYLDLVRHVRGNTSKARRDSIRYQRDAVLSKLRGSFSIQGDSGDLKFRRNCVQAAKDIQREYFLSRGWERARGGKYKLCLPEDILMLSIDYGTYSAHAEFDLRIQNLGLRLAPSVLFCVYLDRFLVYSPVAEFSERFSKVVEVLGLFGRQLQNL
jgi:hypothetical protein